MPTRTAPTRTIAACLPMLVVLALAACSPGAAKGQPVNFRATITFNIEGPYAQPVQGSSTLDGTFGIDYLRSQPVEASAKDDATWKTASDVTWSTYESGTNCGLGGKCTPCESKYVAPNHDVAVGTRIDSRSGDTVVAYVWTYNDPNPTDIRYHSGGCNDAEEFGGRPWGGWGPILITATMGSSDVTALSISNETPVIDANCGCTLKIERLP